ncbi:MAG: branched-chain amino acid transport system II carrier protein [Peptococcaceae bacterium]|nr:branched-chain amino acid transport system II carrier protein [Peptococcaceae bacterium]
MKEKLSFSQLLSLSLMLFALFFGAGNMIFPPAMGQLAGTNVWAALAGFIVTDVGLPLLGIAAVVFAGRSLNNMVGRAGKKFGTFFIVLMYLLIGPLFAIPRTGSVSFELAVMPFVSNTGISPMVFSVIFTAIFFGSVYILSANPSKIVAIVGKVLTPILLVSIFIIGLSAVINPIGPLREPVGDYTTIAFFKGMVEGYMAMDALAAGIFALIVIDNVEAMGIQKEGNIVKYTLLAGLIAAIGLAVVYGILAYAGATAGPLGQFANGGQLLSAVAKHIFGTAGMLILGIAVLFACLTTAIGLTTACGEYFSDNYVKLEYNHVIIAVCLFSFVVSNIGLTQLLSITLPGLLMVYPVLMALVLAGFLDKWFKGRKPIYIGILIGTALISIPNGLETLAANYSISTAAMSNLLQMVPFYNLGLGWVIPAVIGGAIGYIVSVVKK